MARDRDPDLCDACRLPKRRNQRYVRVHMVHGQELLAMQLCGLCWDEFVPQEVRWAVRAAGIRFGELTK